MRIEGSSAVVTGATGGQGAAYARALLERGAAPVVVSGRREAQLDELSRSLCADFGDVVHPVVADLAVPGATAAVLAAAPRPVDLFVANAGIVRGYGSETTADDWQTSWQVNVGAHIEAAEALVPAWLAGADAGDHGGCFVSIASAAGLLTQVGVPAYSVTKRAAVGYAEWLAATYGDLGVQVVCLCSMAVETAMLGADTGIAPEADMVERAVRSVGHIASPEEVAASMIDAIEEERFFAFPHPEVPTLVERKVADPDRWLRGMQRFRRSLES